MSESVITSITTARVPTYGGRLNKTALCREALRLVDGGEYEAAVTALGGLWQGVGRRPLLTQTTVAEKALLLFTAGVLTGFQGSARQIGGAQEAAKDLLSESLALFQEVSDDDFAAWAKCALAVCYWRLGAIDEARIVAQEALHSRGKISPEVTLRLHLSLIISENLAHNFKQSEIWLTRAEPLLTQVDNLTLQGSFYFERAVVQKSLAHESLDERLHLAVTNYIAAAGYYERVGHLSFLASIYNNLGNLLGKLERFCEAHKYLDCGLATYRQLSDKLHQGMVWESKARLYLAEQKLSEAENAAHTSVRFLREADRFAVLAESLTTLGSAQARLGKALKAEKAFRHAFSIADTAGDRAGAGRALLCLLEELGTQLTAADFIQTYRATVNLLGESSRLSIHRRLRALAETAAFAERSPDIVIQPTVAETLTDLPPGFSLKDTVQNLEARYISLALEKSGNRVVQASALLGMQHQTLSLMLRKRHKDLLARLQKRKPRQAKNKDSRNPDDHS